MRILRPPTAVVAAVEADAVRGARDRGAVLVGVRRAAAVERKRIGARDPVVVGDRVEVRQEATEVRVFLDRRPRHRRHGERSGRVVVVTLERLLETDVDTVGVRGIGQEPVVVVGLVADADQGVRRPENRAGRRRQRLRRRFELPSPTVVSRSIRTVQNGVARQAQALRQGGRVEQRVSFCASRVRHERPQDVVRSRRGAVRETDATDRIVRRERVRELRRRRQVRERARLSVRRRAVEPVAGGNDRAVRERLLPERVADRDGDLVGMVGPDRDRGHPAAERKRRRTCVRGVVRQSDLLERRTVIGGSPQAVVRAGEDGSVRRDRDRRDAVPVCVRHGARERGAPVVRDVHARPNLVVAQCEQRDAGADVDRLGVGWVNSNGADPVAHDLAVGDVDEVLTAVGAAEESAVGPEVHRVAGLVGRVDRRCGSDTSDREEQLVARAGAGDVGDATEGALVLPRATERRQGLRLTHIAQRVHVRVRLIQACHQRRALVELLVLRAERRRNHPLLARRHEVRPHRDRKECPRGQNKDADRDPLETLVSERHPVNPPR